MYHEKTAILFSGSAYNVRYSLDSLMENLIIPNNADVFVFTNRYCKRRKTPASEICTAEENWDKWLAKNETTINDYTPLGDDEIQLIKSKIGDRLKVIEIAEEVPEYWEYLLSERKRMFDEGNQYVEYSNTHGITPPHRGALFTTEDEGSIRYTVDQYRHIKKCYELMEAYENQNGFKYDFVMRARIDFICPFEFNLYHYMPNHDEQYLYSCGGYGIDTIEYADEFCWFSKRPMASKIFPNLDKIGLLLERKYNTTKDNNDFILDAECQYALLLKELNIPVFNVKIHRSATYTAGNDGFDYFNYEFRRDITNPELEYQLACNSKSDINEHLPILRKYAEECAHITECGTRYCNSTIAFLSARRPYFASYDVQHNDKIDYLILIAKENNINFEFKHMNPTDTENNQSLLEETDLLFIDTNHNVETLEPELRLHSPKVRKYIIMHDTVAFWERGQGWDNGGGGMKLALEPFLENNKEWVRKEVFTNNNGLTILQRISNGN